MNLKRLELFGFKSFMRKLDLHFSDGITVIVGPNGCGKTNVTDALRWVLGEANARLLRGNRMEDLIFNGTRDYKPLNLAEVGLTVDNSSGILPIDYSEVTVTRRVLRSGDSEFLINKMPCRLKDITELFLDTGLGSRAYSVIEREMVEMVLADQPEKRRELLEEAAGIMKYKIRERQAQRKLSATDEDLARITDVLREVERQVRSLRRQVGAARRYQEARDELRGLEIALALTDVGTMRREEAKLVEVLAGRADERAGAENRITVLETDIERLRLQAAEADSSLTEMQREVDALAEEARRVESENLIGSERRDALVETSRRLAAERDAQAELIRTGTERRAELATEAAASDEGIAACDARLAAADDTLARLETSLADRRTELSRSREAAEAAAAEVGRFRTEHGNLAARREHLADRDAVLAEEVAQIGAAVEGRRRERSELTARRDALREELSRLEAEETRAAARGEELAAEREAAREEEAARAVECEAARSGLEMLRGLRDSFEGYGEGARTLLAGEGGVAGVAPLADRLHVTSPDLVPALDAALATAVQYLVAPDGAAALAAVRALRTGAGRATLVVSEAFGAAGGGDEPSLPADPAIVGRAREFVTVDGDLDRVLDVLLARCVIVETLDDAVRLSRRSEARGFRFIARNGDWAAHPGIVHGGGAEEAHESRLLGRADRIRELESTVARLEEARRVARERVERLAADRESVNARRAELATARDEVREKLATEERAEERSRVQLATNEERLAAIAREREELARAGQELVERHEALGAELAEREAEHARLDDACRDRESELVASTEDRDAAQRTGHELRLERQRLAAEREKLDLEAERLEEARQTASARSERLAAEIAEADRIVGELARTLEAGQDRFAAKAEELEQRRHARDGVAGRRAEVLQQLREVEEERHRWGRLRSQAQEAVHEAEMEQTRLGAAISDLVSRIEREFQVDLAAPGATEEHGTLLNAGEEELAEARRQLGEVRLRLQRLGPVNLVALEQYEREAQRHEFLKTQKEDLEAARESLRRTIRKINRTARTLFVETLDRVRENFRHTFGTLFEGGHADIRLSGDEDPLHAPIEIYARPRGKRLSNISLLSSGERSLTAVAFLFAIYLVKPSPFCILDEVDAPLDDANIGRFLSMLEKVAQKTQIVMITHNKKTMEVADYLYGVTMEEPGISKLVSVRLGAAELLAEPRDGNGREDAANAEELVLEETA